MDCKGCVYDGYDCIFCAKVKLKEEMNEFIKELPVIRKFAEEEIECPYRESKEKWRRRVMNK